MTETIVHPPKYSKFKFSLNFRRIKKQSNNKEYYFHIEKINFVHISSPKCNVNFASMK